MAFRPSHFFRSCVSLFSLMCAIFIGSRAPMLCAQTIHVDISPGNAVAFDPDKAMGTSMDILLASDIDAVYAPAMVKQGLSAGWGPITYRQNTELTYDAWHWNPIGTWSDPAHKSGYFLGSAEPGKQQLDKSYGYRLPHRGTTRSDSGQAEYSRMTDGDPATYWKSNPYLTSKFTGESEDNPQWVLIEFAHPQDIDAIQIAWANPYATHYAIEYWNGKAGPLDSPNNGAWVKFPYGDITAGAGGSKLLRLADQPVSARYLRISMTASSNTCDTHGSSDIRNCVGYAIAEISVGDYDSQGQFIDLVQHSPDQAQTVTQISSVDPWHTEADIVSHRIQTGFDLFFKSGYTNHLPAMIPVAMFYSTPEDSAAELAYIEKRGYPVSYVEMAEEPDGNSMQPEDYASLYMQWATALHKVDPKLKLGGPVFTGENEDIKVWPDAQGRTSWLGRFIDDLKAHNRLADLAFVSFEHYPYEPCQVHWTDLYREPQLVEGILKTWRDDGVPADVPLMNTESNLSWGLTDPMQDLFAALWLADSVGSFLTHAGPGAAYYHSPVQPEPLKSGCNGWSTYGNFVANDKLEISQYTAPYFAGRLLNLDWVHHGAGVHQLFPASSDLTDDAKHTLVTAYAVKRPPSESGSESGSEPAGEWSLLLVNRDPSNAHQAAISFENQGQPTGLAFTGPVKVANFGAAEFVWHASGATSHADPDGPETHTTVQWKPGQRITLPRASITVLTGRVSAAQ